MPNDSCAKLLAGLDKAQAKEARTPKPSSEWDKIKAAGRGIPRIGL